MLNEKDYIEIHKEAKRLNKSPQAIVRERINYRLCKQGEKDCRLCENLSLDSFDKNKRQCYIIGEGLDFYANVDGQHICDLYDGVKSKCDLVRDHKYKLY